MEDSKNINNWAKELKHNEKVAKKYQGVKTVEDILKVARKDGYTFSKSELLDLDLGAVAGGGGQGAGIGANLNNKQFSNNSFSVGDINANIKLWGDDINIQNSITQQIQNVLSGANTHIEHVDHHGVINSSYKKN